MSLDMSLQEACWELWQRRALCSIEPSPAEQGPSSHGQCKGGCQRPGSTASPSRQIHTKSSTGRENGSAWRQQQGRGSQASPGVTTSTRAGEVHPSWAAWAWQSRGKQAQERSSHPTNSLPPCPQQQHTALSRQQQGSFGDSGQQPHTTLTASGAAQGTWPGGHRLWLLIHPLRQPSPSSHLRQPGSLCPTHPSNTTSHTGQREGVGGWQEEVCAATAQLGPSCHCSQGPRSTRGRKTRAQQRPGSPVLLPRTHLSTHTARESWETATAQVIGLGAAGHKTSHPVLHTHAVSGMETASM